MRISSGYAKGMEIKSPSGLVTRPTSDKVRAALLNSIQLDVEDARVLDLFAGTGALGLEALSRGAQFCCFVDQAKDSCRVLRTNLDEFQRRLGAQKIDLPKAEVVMADVAKYLQRGGEQRTGFNLVFADPPYAAFAREAQTMLEMLPSFLLPDARVILESDASGEAPLVELLQKHVAWEMLRNKNYGNTRLYTLCYNGSHQQEDVTP